MSFPNRKIGSILSSLQLTTVLISILILLSIVGALIPQYDGTEESIKSVLSFRRSFPILSILGLESVFDSWLFLACVSGLFVNLIACTALRLPERIRHKLEPDQFLDSTQVASLREVVRIYMPCAAKSASEYVYGYMDSLGYRVRMKENCAFFQKGGGGWLAAPVTHLGIVVLLIGALTSALFSYSGVLRLEPGNSQRVKSALTQAGLFAKVPDLDVKLLSTKMEVYAGGEPRQWFSTICAAGSNKPVGTLTLSVNSPGFLAGVDFYQSDWSIRAACLSIKDRIVKVPLEEMPHGKMGLFELADGLRLICVLDPDSRLALYVKADESARPVFLASLTQGQCLPNFPVGICYERPLPEAGIKFKSDPGLPITYTAFFFLLVGSILVALPDLKIWAAFDSPDNGGTICLIGFTGIKSAGIMRSDLRKIECFVTRQALAGDYREREAVTVEH